MLNRVAIIDLDPLVHIVANVQYSAGNRDNKEAVISHTKTFLNTVLKSTNSKYFIMFVQMPGHENFRKEIIPEYKSHRLPSDGAILWKKLICDTLVEQGANGLFNIESDDAIMLYHRKCKDAKLDYVIVENDKDLAMVPGLHYNPYKKKLEQRWYTYTTKEAERSLWVQTMTGDATDMPNELCGIFKCGPKTAEKLLPLDTSTKYYKYIVMSEYTKKYGISEGLRRMANTYDMVYLLEYPNDIPETVTVLETDPLQFISTTETLFDNKDESTKSKFNPR